MELLLITLTANAKLEKMFSRMNQVKNDWRNRLTHERFEHNLRIGEDGPSIKDFYPEQLIMHWSNEKMQRINGAKPHRYPNKCKKTERFSSVDVISYCMSDFEADCDEE